MKQLVFSLVVFAALLLVMGCSENSVTDPLHAVNHEVTDMNQNHDAAMIDGSIPLEGILVLNVMFNRYFAIEGQINYTLELAVADPTTPQGNVILNLSVKAILIDVDVPEEEWTISEETSDVLVIPGDSVVELEKSFAVQGSIEGLRLVCRFLVTRESIILNSRRLKIFEDNAQGH